jgi:hypothetical protein
MLTNDIDYMNKESKILSDESLDVNIEFYMFYKSIDKSDKIDRPPVDNQGLDTDLILKKNVKILLQEIDDLGGIERSVQARNNILDIKRCILQILEKHRMNKGTLNYSIDLILESLVLKYKSLEYNNSSFKSFIRSLASDWKTSQDLLK